MGTYKEDDLDWKKRKILFGFCFFILSNTSVGNMYYFIPKNVFQKKKKKRRNDISSLHCLLSWIKADAAKSLQSCPTLCDPIPGILQARTLEWVAISFSNA